jgi:hypothetical protein
MITKVKAEGLVTWHGDFVIWPGTTKYRRLQGVAKNPKKGELTLTCIFGDEVVLGLDAEVYIAEGAEKRMAEDEWSDFRYNKQRNFELIETKDFPSMIELLHSAA